MHYCIGNINTKSSLQSFTSKPNDVTVEDDDPRLSAGDVNVLVRLRASDGSTVIAKYAPPYMRVSHAR